jgi:hypothetical protein
MLEYMLETYGLGFYEALSRVLGKVSSDSPQSQMEVAVLAAVQQMYSHTDLQRNIQGAQFEQVPQQRQQEGGNINID